MKTVLYPQHCALNGRIVEFCGWEMPLMYQGIIKEHYVVRQQVGIFDVSHMGRILVEGRDSEQFLDYLATNTIFGKGNLSAIYTVMCNESGRCIDDVIVYKCDATHFFLVVNAGNRDKDLKHLKNQSEGYNVTIKDRYQEDGILAIQGPYAQPLIMRFFPEAVELKPMHFLPQLYRGHSIIVSRTGYTGADGFEIYAPNESIPSLWNDFLSEGASFGIQPIGLGARDTLRLEMGYALYGHEISEQITPIESVSAWTVKWSKEEFLGKHALWKLQHSVEKRSEYGIVLLEKGVAREGYSIFKNDVPIGQVTSGALSPSLNKSVAIILVKSALSVGEIVEVAIRENKVKAEVTKLPFFRGSLEPMKESI